MKSILLISALIFSSQFLRGQSSMSFQHEASSTHPFGKLNPKAPPRLADFAELIGDNHCKSVVRTPAGDWQKDTIQVIWRYKYILDGMAVQDETLKADGTHTTSIRQFDPISEKWFVTFFTTARPGVLPLTWTGQRQGNEIILYNEQKAPNGTDGYYKITFSEITTNSFKWLGEWTDKAEKFSYPTWYIQCTK